MFLLPGVCWRARGWGCQLILLTLVLPVFQLMPPQLPLLLSFLSFVSQRSLLAIPISLVVSVLGRFSYPPETPSFYWSSWYFSWGYLPSAGGKWKTTHYWDLHRQKTWLMRCTSAHCGSRWLQSFIYLPNPGYQTPVIFSVDEIDSRGCWGQGYVWSIIQPSRVELILNADKLLFQPNWPLYLS